MHATFEVNMQTTIKIFKRTLIFVLLLTFALTATAAISHADSKQCSKNSSIGDTCPAKRTAFSGQRPKRRCNIFSGATGSARTGSSAQRRRKLWA